MCKDRIIIDDVEIDTSDILMDSIIAKDIEYSVELSNRVKFDIKTGRIIKDIIDYALMAIHVDTLGSMGNENFIIINRQLKIVLVGDKIGNRITIEMAESLDDFKIFGL